MDLAKAYAIRAQKEKDERIASERERQAEAARKREGKLKLAELLKRATLNDAASRGRAAFRVRRQDPAGPRHRRTAQGAERR
jgi:uncharacterized protein YaiL (DUF2058 family)